MTSQEKNGCLVSIHDKETGGSSVPRRASDKEEGVTCDGQNMRVKALL